MSEVTSAGKATNIAVDFLKQYYYFAVPKSAKKSDNQWVVQINVGLVSEKVARVEIDSVTGEITSYDLPVPPEKRVI